MKVVIGPLEFLFEELVIIGVVAGVVDDVIDDTEIEVLWGEALMDVALTRIAVMFIFVTSTYCEVMFPATAYFIQMEPDILVPGAVWGGLTGKVTSYPKPGCSTPM